MSWVGVFIFLVMVNRFSVFVMLMMCEVIGLVVLLVLMVLMKDLLIFKVFSGNCCRYCRLE